MSSVNYTEVTFNINDKEYIFTGYYRFPKDNIDDFLLSFSNYLRQSSDFKNHIICGNFNIDILNSKKLKVINYLNIFTKFRFVPYINKVTRKSNISATRTATSFFCQENFKN